MLNLGPRTTGVGTSLALPASGAGLLMLFVISGFLGILRFTFWLLGSSMSGISGAGAVIFAVLAAAYVSRYLVVAAQAAAEGYDGAPAFPDPREVEYIFGASLGMIIILLFAGLPIIVLHALGIASPPVILGLLGLAAVYVPMGILVLGVREDMGQCFPGLILSGIAAVAGKYLSAALCCAVAGLLIYGSRTGDLGRLPTFFGVILDVIASWLLMASVHRVGVLHREDLGLKSLIPFPEPEKIESRVTGPGLPTSDIERILEERRKNDALL